MKNPASDVSDESGAAEQGDDASVTTQTPQKPGSRPADTALASARALTTGDSLATASPGDLFSTLGLAMQQLEHEQ